MEKTVAMLSDDNAEVDRLREELTPKIKLRLQLNLMESGAETWFILQTGHPL